MHACIHECMKFAASEVNLYHQMIIILLTFYVYDKCEICLYI